MKKISSGLSILTCVLMLAGCVNRDYKQWKESSSNDTTEWLTDSRVTHIPFKNIDNRIVIPITLNGGKKLGFILDTGAAASMLLESHQTTDLDLVTQGQLTINGGGNGEGSKGSFIHNVDIGTGDIVLINKTILNATLENMPFFKSLDEAFLDGILGYDLFNFLVVEINHDQSLITLYETDEFESISHDRLNNGWVKMPLEISGGLIYIKSKVLLKDQNLPLELKFLLDTGSNGSISLSPSAHDKIELPEDQLTIESSGFNGVFETKLGLVSYVDIGGFQVKELIGTFTDFSVAPNKRNSSIHGAIGMGLFSKFNVLFNYQGEYMLIKPNNTFDTPITAGRSGLRTLIHKDGYIVKSTDEKLTEKQPNLRASDVILSFNNEPATPENMVKFRELLSSQADSVNICWMKESERYCADIELMDRL
ncbi:hypothetical protein MAH1_26540 [Sessilibacter sp. MAH1]